MTDWYWRNQQLAVLDRWAAEGLVNHCDVKRVSKVQPLLVDPRYQKGSFEGSKVVLEISASMRDYLARREDGEVVEGSKKYTEVSSLWTFQLIDGEWKVSNIDASETLHDYLDMARDLPSVREVVPPADRAG